MFLRWLNNRLSLSNDDPRFEVRSDNWVRMRSHFIHTFEDFSSAVGSGASALITNENTAVTDKQGICMLRTAAGSASIARIGSPGNGSTTALQLGFHDWIWESSSQLQLLPIAATSFVIIDGFTNVLSTGGVSRGVYFVCTDALFNGNWAVSTVDGTQTLEDTGIPADLNWNKRRIEINRSCTSAKFFINGVQVREITTNIPNGNPSNDKQLNCQFMIINQGSSTSVDRAIAVDYLELVGRKYSI